MGIQETMPNQSPITKAFLEQILKHQVLDFHTSGGSNPGDNFTSVLISIEVTFPGEKQPLHLLFKTFPNHPTRQKLLEDSNLFLKEHEVYADFLPQLINFQRAAGNGNESEILRPAVPELVAGAAIDYTKINHEETIKKDPMQSNFLLMVDMRKTHSYQMTNKLKGQDYHHVKLVLDELAKYHALNHAYKVQTKLSSFISKFACLKDPFFANPTQRPIVDAMMKGNIEIVLEALQDYCEMHPGLAEKMRGLAPVAGDYFATFLDPNGVDEETAEALMRIKPTEYASTPPTKEQWIVAGHGDCWTNNMLFKYNKSNKPIACCLVDLQCARESCIMADIVYFIFTSTDTDFRKQYLDEMLNWYYERFLHYCDHLKVSPFPGFSLENFRRKFHRSKIFGFLFSCLCLPIILQRPETTVNMDSLDVNENEGGNAGEDFAAMFQKLGRDEDDNNLLRDRFSKLLTELLEEGVI